MASLAEIARALFGVWRLLLFDGRAFAFFDLSASGALRSFTAAAIVAPFYAILIALRFDVAGGDASPGRYLLIEAIAFVISWTLYPLIAEQLARQAGSRPRFPAYLCVYNWAMVAQNAVIVAIALMGEARVLPGEFLAILGLFALALTAGYLWYLVRVALVVSPFTAVGFVAIDLLVSILITGTAKALM